MNIIDKLRIRRLTRKWEKETEKAREAAELLRIQTDLVALGSNLAVWDRKD